MRKMHPAIMEAMVASFSSHDMYLYGFSVFAEDELR